VWIIVGAKVCKMLKPEPFERLVIHMVDWVKINCGYCGQFVFTPRYNDTDPRKVFDPNLLVLSNVLRMMTRPRGKWPRIFAEFLLVFQKDVTLKRYLKAYSDLGLLDTVFPGLQS